MRVGISVSKGLKISGALGTCVSLKIKNDQVSETVIGEGGTVEWYVGTADHTSTLGFVFENEKIDQNVWMGKPVFIQLRTIYKHSSGQIRLRVTSVERFFGGDQKQDYANNFDQEAAIALTARVAMDLTKKSEPREVLKWIDKQLIRLYHKFGTFKKGEVSSFHVGDEMNLVPQFFYYLRKSTFILTFGVSLDEHAYYKLIFSRENVANSLTMIQPSLIEYNMQNEMPQPTLCDINSLSDENIILFDNYFNVVIWHGDTIASWRNQGFQELEGYEYFKQILEMPREDAAVRIKNLLA